MLKMDENCFICGAKNWKKLYEARDFLHDIDGKFWLIECANCGLVTSYPRLSMDQLEKFYPDDYMAFPVSIDEETEWHKRADRQRGLNRRCSFACQASGKNTGTVLDVGSATGIFLKGMQDRGWESYGIEPSSYAANYAREQLKLNVTQGYLEDGLFQADFFDLVTLWDVFEHIPNPVDVLETIHKIIKPNGVLLITTPNSKSWDRYMFKEAWAGWDTPRHYYIYNQKSMVQLLNKHGFKFKRIKSFTNRHGSLVYSIRFWLKNKNASPRKRETIERILNSYLFRALTYPYFMFADAINRSASMTVVFIKE